jgi:protein-disulfide isomerase
VLLALGALALGYAIYSLSIGVGGPEPAKVGGVNDVQRIFGGVEQEASRLGADDAPITVNVFNDVQCAPCADYEIDTIDPIIDERVRAGDVAFEFRHFSVAQNDTTLAAIGAEAAGEQDRQWQYLDTFVRNQDLAEGRAVDEEILREVAEAVPELDVDQWERDFGDPASEELVRDDAKLAFELKLPAEPAVVVDGPGGERKLIDAPSREDIEAAIAQVSGSD